MRIIFAGTPEPAACALTALLASNHDVIAVITRPDARKGRGRTYYPSPVKELATSHDIPVLTPTSLRDNDEFRSELRQLKPDCVPVVAYGNLIPQDVLDLVPYGFINLHFSLLPRWRGAAPVQAAIHAGDAVTGATTFRIDPGLDTGDIIGQLTEPIDPADTADSLLERLAHRGADLLTHTMDMIADGTAEYRPQDGVATHAHKITVADARVDWTQPAESIDRAIRAVTSSPGAWSTIGEQRIKLGPVTHTTDPHMQPGDIHVAKNRILVGTGTTPVSLGRVQPSGKKPMPAADWARGTMIEGKRFE
ncbi:methionyl-tRNA formyltransferase [Corynebacterium matruchotii]|uniref:methionyl-tRNA formyltransferase n=1 Tax=Corynebacterium matruchotii TaxID=43768 RepID=UPI00288979D9|nr:methionyl-tRNA formyltransferase [Corynebacterium matruchotii]